MSRHVMLDLETPEFGVKHNALDDAKWQAVYMSKIFKEARWS